jgi:uncharacterized protein (TIGR02246 family)
MISADDIEAIKQLGWSFEAAWNAHDMDAFAALFTPTVDFVVVTGAWFGGRDNVVKHHAERHATNFRASNWQTQGVAVRPLSRDICLAHVNWAMSGDMDRDETPRQPREGIFTWIVRRGEAGWLIDAAH